MAIMLLLKIADSGGRMRALSAMLPAILALFLLVKDARADSTEQASEVAQALGLKPGMVIAEVGAGKGATTVEVAKIVGPSGRVYSTEVDPRQQSPLAPQFPVRRRDRDVSAERL